MTDSHQQWSDGRIDDLVRRINGVPEKVARIEQQVIALENDRVEDRATLVALVKQLEHKELEGIKARKADRSLLVATFLGVATIAVSAAGIIVSVLV